MTLTKLFSWYDQELLSKTAPARHSDFHLEAARVPGPGAGVKAESPQVDTVLKPGAEGSWAGVWN